MENDKTKGLDCPSELYPTLSAIFKPVLSIACMNTDPEALEDYLAKLIATNYTAIQIQVQNHLHKKG